MTDLRVVVEFQRNHACQPGRYIGDETSASLAVGDGGISSVTYPPRAVLGTLRFDPQKRSLLPVSYEEYNRFRLKRPVIWSLLSALALGAWCFVLTQNIGVSVFVSALSAVLFCFMYGPGGPLRERVERKINERENSGRPLRLAR